MKGVVVKFDGDRGFGFVRARGADGDHFVHISDVQDHQPLRVGQWVEFTPARTAKGLAAKRVLPGKQQRSPRWLYGAIGAAGAAGLIGVMRFYEWSPVVAYFAAINAVTFSMYGYDKAIAGTSIIRVPEFVLLSAGLLGGSPAALAAQRMFRHKTIKASFQALYWAIVVFQVVLLLVYFLR